MATLAHFSEKKMNMMFAGLQYQVYACGRNMDYPALEAVGVMLMTMWTLRTVVEKPRSEDWTYMRHVAVFLDGPSNASADTVGLATAHTVREDTVLDGVCVCVFHVLRPSMSSRVLRQRRW